MPGRPAVLAEPGPRPAGRLGVGAVLLVSALVLVGPSLVGLGQWLPGRADAPMLTATASWHALVHELGPLDAAGARTLGWPTVGDRVPLVGLPVAPLLTGPLAFLTGEAAALTLMVLLGLWGAGVAMADVAGRWWRSAGAAVVAGITYQTGLALAARLAEGQLVAALGAAGLPLVLGATLRSLHGERRATPLAGAWLGLLVLTDLFTGGLAVVGAVVLVGFAAVERRAVAPTLRSLVVGGGFAGLVGVGWASASKDVAEGVATAVRDGDGWTRVGQLLEARDLGSALAADPLAWLTPVAVALALLAVVRQPRQAWLAPAALVFVGAAVAAGPVLLALPGGPLLPGPGLLLAWLPAPPWTLAPTAALLLSSVGLSLWAGGGASALGSRWAAASVVVLLGEALVVSPNLPLPRAAAGPSKGAALLAERRGPLLLLPFPHGVMRHDGAPVLDQLVHRRPLVDPILPPDDPRSRTGARVLLEVKAVDFLLGCETRPGAEPTGSVEDGLAQLARLGVFDVYVDLEAVAAWEQRTGGSAEQYLRCVGRYLGEDHVDDAVFRRYATGDGA